MALFPATSVLWGSHVGSDSTLTYSNSTTQLGRTTYLEGIYGRTFAVIRTFRDWDGGTFDASYERTMVDGGRILWGSEKFRTGGSTAIPYSEIAAGTHDSHIKDRADEFKLLNQSHPMAGLMFTCQHEPEGEQADGVNKIDYKNAYIQYRSVFLARLQSSDAVAPRYTGPVAFGPIYYSTECVANAGGAATNPYWPGDAYCDFLGIDTYNWYPAQATTPPYGNRGPWREFNNTFNMAGNVQFAKEHDKRIAIGELGCFEDAPTTYYDAKNASPPTFVQGVTRWDSTAVDPDWRSPPYQYPADPRDIKRESQQSGVHSKAGWIDRMVTYVASQKLNDGITPLWGAICWYDTVAVYNRYSNTSAKAVNAISDWGQSATFGGGIALSAAAGTISFTSGLAKLKISFTLRAAAGTITFTGGAATLGIAILNAAAGTIAFTGSAASIITGASLAAATGTITFTGGVATLSQPVSLAASAGLITFGGGSAIIVTPGITLSATAGTFTLVGGNHDFVTPEEPLVAVAGRILIQGGTVTFYGGAYGGERHRHEHGWGRGHDVRSGRQER